MNTLYIINRNLINCYKNINKSTYTVFENKLNINDLNRKTKNKKKLNVNSIPIEEIYKPEHIKEFNSSKGISVLINETKFQYIGNF